MNVQSTDGISISYKVKGEGSPALVFVHGWCCNSSYWDLQTEYFQDKFTVVTLDLAGHGESGGGREDWNMKAFGEDVASVIRELSLNQAILVGHSMGGRVVVEAAAMLPDKVIGIVGADCFQQFGYSGQSREMVERNLATFRDNFKNMMSQTVVSMFGEKADPALVERVLEGMCSADPGMAIAATIGIAEHDLRSVLETLQIPVRVIGSSGAAYDLETAEKLKTDFKVIFIQDVGHFVMMEAAETFNSLLQGFIREFTP